MSYLAPSEFATKMVDAGESKVFMSTRDTLIRAYMAGAILALAAVFAVTIAVQTGIFLLGAILFPVGFCMLYLMGFDLLTGVFVLTPLALLDKRPGVTISGVLRNWGLVFIGNFAGALTVAVMMAFVFTYGFNADAGPIAAKVASIGESRTLGYSQYGFDGWMTIFIRGMLCNWMVSLVQSSFFFFCSGCTVMVSPANSVNCPLMLVPSAIVTFISRPTFFLY